MSSPLTAPEARDLFEVRDGALINKYARRMVRAGSVCGSPGGDGYLHFRYLGRHYYVHRVIWLVEHGEEAEQIDHINGNRTDNRIENLRSVSCMENMRNQKARKTNTSGVTGVSWCQHKKRWLARIHAGGRNRFLGYFKTLDEAKAERKSAEALHGYHANHGRASLPTTDAPDTLFNCNTKSQAKKNHRAMVVSSTAQNVKLCEANHADI